jgi:glycosyltransferase involved in cell wall biosynthesis
MGAGYCIDIERVKILAKEIKMDIVWISWERHRRTLELSNFLNITPIIFTLNLPRIIKHPYLLLKSAIFLIKNRPQVLFVQNPSILLTVLACFLQPILKYRLIVDTHNAGISPDSILVKKYGFLFEYFQHKADLTIVTNKSLADIVSHNGGKPFILPDKLPVMLPAAKQVYLEGKYNIVYICSFNNDEPYMEVIKCAKNLPEDVLIYITGNFKKQERIGLVNLPPRIIYTGFLSEDDYWQLLYAADIIMVLTKRENCLVCGGYEAIATGKPLILSDKKILREYFYKGTIFTANRSEPISDTIFRGIKGIEKLQTDVKDLKHELNKTWLLSGNRLKGIIQGELI